MHIWRAYDVTNRGFPCIGSSLAVLLLCLVYLIHVLPCTKPVSLRCLLFYIPSLMSSPRSHRLCRRIAYVVESIMSSNRLCRRTVEAIISIGICIGFSITHRHHLFPTTSDASQHRTIPCSLCLPSPVLDRISSIFSSPPRPYLIFGPIPGFVGSRHPSRSALPLCLSSSGFSWCSGVTLTTASSVTDCSSVSGLSCPIAK